MNLHTCLVASALFFVSQVAWGGETWPQFRGPEADGHTDATGLPLTWTGEKNIAWKAPIHDRGWSSPVIWHNQIWLTTATADGHQLYAVCVDRKTGQIVHDLHVFDVEKPESIAAINSYASPTSVIEAGRIYLFDEASVTTVIEPARQFKKLATNMLNGEQLMASPAAAGNSLFVRTEKHLYRIDNVR